MPSASGGTPVGSPIARRASAASALISPNAPAERIPRPPPPYAAAIAIRRATRALVTARI